MKIRIAQTKGGWLSSRGNHNELLSNEELYRYLIRKKSEGFNISFYQVER